MAALRESDLERIVGANYRDVMKNPETIAGDVDEYSATANKIERVHDQNFSYLVCFLVGVALMVSAHYTATGLTWSIQMTVAVLFVLVGVGGYLRARGIVARLQTRLQTLRPPSPSPL